MIDESHKEKFLYEEWKNFNNPEFKYAECSTCSDRLGLSLLKQNKGLKRQEIWNEQFKDVYELAEV